MKHWTKEEQETISSYKRYCFFKAIKWSATLGAILGVGVAIYTGITSITKND